MGLEIIGPRVGFATELRQIFPRGSTRFVVGKARQQLPSLSEGTRTGWEGIEQPVNPDVGSLPFPRVRKKELLLYPDPDPE